MKALSLFVVSIIASACLLTAGAAPEEAKAKLAPLQEFVGDWKGVGQRERGKTDGSWIETASWAWKFDSGAASLVFSAADAKYLPSGILAPADRDGEFQLLVPTSDSKHQMAYIGQLVEGKLVLEADGPAEGLPSRITLRLLAEGKRLVALYETKSSSDRYVRLAEVGYTRVGSGFGRGSQGPECIVTGGYGSMTVSYEGKTYPVCCTGCKDYFNEDPQRAIEEYLARKQKEKQAN